MHIITPRRSRKVHVSVLLGNISSYVRYRKEVQKNNAHQVKTLLKIHSREKHASSWIAAEVMMTILYSDVKEIRKADVGIYLTGSHYYSNLTDYSSIY